MRALAAGCVIAALLLPVAACGKVKTLPDADAGPGSEDAAAGPDAGAPGPCDRGGPEPTFEEAWECTHEAACGLLARCLLPVELEDCRDMSLELFDGDKAFTHDLLEDAIEAGNIVYHPEEVALCAERLLETDCQVLFSGDAEFYQICPIFTGTVADGDPCITPIECETPNSTCSAEVACPVDEACCVFECIPPAGIGSACSFDGPNCNPGAYCAGGFCRTGAIGQPCDSSSDCDPENWCDGGTCTDRVSSGDGCDDDNECPIGETCVGDDLPGGNGECAGVDELGDDCDSFCIGSQCIQPNEAEFGTCTAFGGDGDDCDESECGFAYTCNEVEGVCEPKGGEGDDCGGGGDCKPQYFCTTSITGGKLGECSSRLADGEDCTEDEHCQSGFCYLTCQAYPGCYE